MSDAINRSSTGMEPVRRAADYLYVELEKLDAPITMTACLALAKHILGVAQRQPEPVMHAGGGDGTFNENDEPVQPVQGGDKGEACLGDNAPCDHFKGTGNQCLECADSAKCYDRTRAAAYAAWKPDRIAVAHQIFKKWSPNNPNHLTDLYPSAQAQYLEAADAILALPSTYQSAPPPLSSLPSGESGPPVMATVGGADTAVSSTTRGPAA